MKITPLGHSSFILESSNGTKIITDPFDERLGYKVYTESADILTISHHHFSHDYVKGVSNNPIIIDTLGLFNVLSINIQGLPSYHDKFYGSKRGSNIIYIFEMDGFRLCHLGDLCHELTQSILSKIGPIDILFIPVGGNFTLDYEEAYKVSKCINSHIIIPMHYKTNYINLPIDGLEKFIEKMKNGKKIKCNSLTINAVDDKVNTVLLFNI